MAPALPAGTVTFLFSDVEGSTRLLDELGAEGYARELALHRRVVRDAIGAHEGVEVDTQGDAFFVAFATAPGALAAADAICSGLAGSPIRVRIGLHSGTPLVTEEGYVGMDVHRAARIAACGHGGQVLVSAATAGLVDGSGLRDLGEHRLKDLSSAERIYQLGPDAFPPLRTLYRTNLPVPSTPFLGRARELEELAELLRGPSRLVTLTGPGGTGKTRLALQLVADGAGDYPGGVFWAPLATLTDARLVLPTIGQAIGAVGEPADHIGDRSLLLLVDNFEHLMDAVADVQRLLDACRNLKVVVTSREVLRLPGEQAYRVPALANADGVALFTARCASAGVTLNDTSAVDELCSRLEHLPLALELAAARVSVLPPEKLLERLSGRLDLLKAGRGVDARQQTLRSTIEWSHDLLEAGEQVLFARLAVFAGGCTLEAAEAVVDADVEVLAALVDKSLVRRDARGRFWMLETIREFALERLATLDDADDLRRRHADHFLALAEEAAGHLVSDRASEWLDRLQAEHPNLGSALDRYAALGDAERLQRLVGALGRFWGLRGPQEEGRRWAELALAADARPTHARGTVLYAAAALVPLDRNANLGAALAGEAVELFEGLGDSFGIAQASWTLGYILVELGELARADELVSDALRRFDELDEPHFALWTRRSLGYIALSRDQLERGRALHEANLTRARALGNRRAEATTLGALALLALGEERIEDALELLLQNMRIVSEADDTALGLDINLSRAAAALALAGEPDCATTVLARSVTGFEEIGVDIPWVSRNNAETLETLHAALDDSAFASAWARGTALTAEEAVAIATVAMAAALDARQRARAASRPPSRVPR